MCCSDFHVSISPCPIHIAEHKYRQGRGECPALAFCAGCDELQIFQNAGFCVESFDESIELCRLSVETNYAPLFEVENGKFTLNRSLDNPKPLADFIKRFKKFRHLTDEDIAALQALCDSKAERLKNLAAL